MPEYTRDIIESVESDSKNVVMESYISLIFARFLYAKKALHIGRDNIGPDFAAIMTRKRSPLTEPFDWV